MSIFGGTINNSEVTKASFFQSYKPAITSGGVGGIGNANTFAQYIQMGKLVYIQGYVVTGAIFGGATQMFVNLPYQVDTSLSSALSGVSPNLVQHLHGLSNNKVISWQLQAGSNLITPLFYDGTNPLTASMLYSFGGWFTKK